ncbi:MAG: hypothetical protein M1814_003455 [Vezdaea aestivalis]|nr:MAG: hypothetical protein M1814_003455 [Vezdaea aestivalis]
MEHETSTTKMSFGSSSPENSTDSQFGIHKALVLEECTLPKLRRSDLCEAFLRGHCGDGSLCKYSHQICQVESPEENVEIFSMTDASTEPNMLLFTPRRHQNPHFDEDGPGIESLQGIPRHDNDHTDIRQIQILPTMDEILATRPTYMPPKDFTEESHLENGSARLIDGLFRHLRYDSVEKIIDISYRACQLLAMLKPRPVFDDYKYNIDTPSGKQFCFYRNAHVSDLLFHERNALVVEISFDCPVALRGRKLFTSGRFEEGMLLGFVALDNDSSLSVTFLESTARQGSDSSKMAKKPGTQASILARFANPEGKDDVRRLCYYFKQVRKGRFALVEFPKCLLPGFYHCLKSLQAQIQGGDLPMSEHLAPKDPLSPIPVTAPKYAMLDNFTYDLTALVPTERKALSTDGAYFNPAGGKYNNLEKSKEFLASNTTLDQGQISALLDNLRRDLAFTQGPPGTGKTFLGLAMVQTLLASRSIGPNPPIIVVCATNHALDSFMEDIESKCTKRICRLGGQSKAKWTEKYSLRALQNDFKPIKAEVMQWRQNQTELKHQFDEVSKLVSGVSKDDDNWLCIKDLVKAKYPEFHGQFAAMHVDQENFIQELKKDSVDTVGLGYKAWLTGKDVDALETLHEDLASCFGTRLAELDEKAKGRIRRILVQLHEKARSKSDLTKVGNIWTMSLADRKALSKDWMAEVGVVSILDQITERHHRYQSSLQARRDNDTDKDRRVLASRDVIGLTTTLCAKFRHLLAQLKCKIVICEEAGEVLEAHSLTTLLPTIEHAIFIGDPKQLRSERSTHLLVPSELKISRPHVEEQILSSEHPEGSRVRLDESLFERLAFPVNADIAPKPMSFLNLQRRMHPDIANISRVTLYPNLLDHESTKHHPRVHGMRNRMYWFDHQQLEDTLSSSNGYSKSASNAAEVELTARLVQYLVEQNSYKFGNIAVLTPYNGQVAALKRRFSTFCSVYLSDADKAVIEDRNFGEELLTDVNNKTQVALSDMLRLATIDNFQGEEAKVIIMSTVRSNKAGKVGFMSHENRINVAVSRARDGFYVIGNSRTMQSSPMWGRIIRRKYAGTNAGLNLAAVTIVSESVPTVISLKTMEIVSPSVARSGSVGISATNYVTQVLVVHVNLPAQRDANMDGALANAVRNAKSALRINCRLLQTEFHRRPSAAFQQLSFPAKAYLTKLTNDVVLFCKHSCAEPRSAAKCFSACSGDGAALEQETGKIQLPCEHTLSIQELDLHVGFHSYLKACHAKNGPEPTKINIGPPQSQLCPTCKATITNVERYNNFFGLANLAKILKKGFGTFQAGQLELLSDVESTRQNLDSTFEFFIKKLSPKAVDLKKNRKLVAERMQRLTEVQSSAKQFKDRAEKFETNVLVLIKATNGYQGLSPFKPTTALYFELIFWLARLTSLQEATKIYKATQSFHDDGSGRAPLFTTTLQASVAKEASAAGYALTKRHEPAKLSGSTKLEFEMLVVTMLSFMLAWECEDELDSSVLDAPLKSFENIMKTSSMVNLEWKLLAQSINDAIEGVEFSSSLALSFGPPQPIHGAELIVCRNGHIGSREVSPCCGECGCVFPSHVENVVQLSAPIVKQEQPEDVRNFLAWMNAPGRSWKGKRASSSPLPASVAPKAPLPTKEQISKTLAEKGGGLCNGEDWVRLVLGRGK